MTIEMLEQERNLARKNGNSAPASPKRHYCEGSRKGNCWKKED